MMVMLVLMIVSWKWESRGLICLSDGILNRHVNRVLRVAPHTHCGHHHCRFEQLCEGLVDDIRPEENRMVPGRAPSSQPQ